MTGLSFMGSKFKGEIMDASQQIYNVVEWIWGVEAGQEVLQRPTLSDAIAVYRELEHRHNKPGKGNKKPLGEFRPEEFYWGPYGYQWAKALGVIK